MGKKQPERREEKKNTAPVTGDAKNEHGEEFTEDEQKLVDKLLEGEDNCLGVMAASVVLDLGDLSDFFLFGKPPKHEDEEDGDDAQKDDAVPEK